METRYRKPIKQMKVDSSELFRIGYSESSVQIQVRETEMPANRLWSTIYRQLLRKIDQSPIPREERLVK